MSNFINTEKKVVLNSLIDSYKERLKNPYYINMENPTITTYYNINMNQTTLEKGSRLAYSELGNNSPIKFNKIEDFYIYGIDKLLVNLDYTELGMESDSIESDGIILPNTIIPCPNDYFSIDYLDKKILLRVLSVNVDTLDNGTNFYQIHFKLDQTNISKINESVVDSFKMIVNNVNSKLNTIIRSDEYYYIEYAEELLDTLKQYYIQLFYFTRVESFIWCKGSYNFYDPYMTEFLIRNGILKNNENYLYITQQCYSSNTFALDYDKSFFRAVEQGNIKDSSRYSCTATYIDDPLSILSSRKEEYYKLDYRSTNNIYLEVIESYSSDLIDRIKTNNLYDNDYKNIIIKYFSNEPINKEDIHLLDNVEFIQSKELFYTIPIIIFIIENVILQLLKK